MTPARLNDEEWHKLLCTAPITRAWLVVFAYKDAVDLSEAELELEFADQSRWVIGQNDHVGITLSPPSDSWPIELGEWLAMKDSYGVHLRLAAPGSPLLDALLGGTISDLSLRRNEFGEVEEARLGVGPLAITIGISKNINTQLSFAVR